MLKNGKRLFAPPALLTITIITILKNIYAIVFIASFLLISCGQNSFEKDLNGKWYGLENDGFTRFFFYPDSLIITELGSPQSVSWIADKYSIEFDYHMLLDSVANTVKIDYILSKTKDTLFCKYVDSAGERSFGLLKAQNYLDFLRKKSGIDFKLPNNNQTEHIELDGNYGFKIFVGTKNGVLNSITEYGNGLDSLEMDMLKFKQKINPQGEYEENKLYYESHFRIFADKSISDEKLTSHIQKLKKSDISSVFRIYQSKEFRNLGYLRGKLIMNTD